MFRLLPIKVRFPKTSLGRLDVETLVVRQELNRMNVARFRVMMEYEKIAEDVGAGSPLVLRWGGERQSDSFFGYVHSFRPGTEGYLRYTEIVAVGAEYPMFNESGRMFYNVGIHNVAQEIADDYRFQVETDPHPMTNDQILQKDDSDWSLLARLADQWGYVLMAHGVTLIFRPLNELLNESHLNAFGDKTYNNFSTPGAHFSAFEPDYSATSGTPQSEVALRGVNPVDVVPIARRETGENIAPVFQEIDVDKTVSSVLEAETKQQSVAVSRRLPYTAKATVLSPFRRRPLDSYRIQYERTPPMTWTVLGVTHMMNGQSYRADMTLGSDGIDYIGTLFEGQMDISVMLKRSRRRRRPVPTIIDSRPYYLGTGANVVVADQRWKARVMSSLEKAEAS